MIANRLGTQIVATEETPSAPVEFKSFGVMNCSLTTVTMDCINWVVAKTKEEDGGFVYWDEGQSVKFWWFDARWKD